jgi:ClpP class serine protease
LREGKSLEEARQKIASTGQTPHERLVNRLTTGRNALVAAADDIAEATEIDAVKTLLIEIDDALGTLKTVIEGDA